MRSLAEGTTALASVGVGGGGGNGDSRNPIHGGDVVVFESDASDLGATDGNGATDIYRRDLSETTTSLVSANPSGVAGNGASTWPVVSVNAEGTDSGNGPSTMPGQRLTSGGLAFNSEATDLGPTDANGVTDVYMRNAGVTHAISTNRSQRTTGNGASRLTTPRGQRLLGPPLFESEATDLGPSVGGSSQVYVSQVMGADLSLFSVQISQIATSAELFFTVFNSGPELALGHVAVIPLPPGVTMVPSQSPACQTVPDVPAVTCSLGTLLVNGSLHPSVRSIVFEHSPPD